MVCYRWPSERARRNQAPAATCSAAVGSPEAGRPSGACHRDRNKKLAGQLYAEQSWLRYVPGAGAGRREGSCVPGGATHACAAGRQRGRRACLSRLGRLRSLIGPRGPAMQGHGVAGAGEGRDAEGPAAPAARRAHEHTPEKPARGRAGAPEVRRGPGCAAHAADPEACARSGSAVQCTARRAPSSCNMLGQ